MKLEDFDSEDEYEDGFNWGQRYMVMGILTSLTGIILSECTVCDRTKKIAKIDKVIDKCNDHLYWKTIKKSLLKIVEEYKGTYPDTILSLEKIIQYREENEHFCIRL